MQKPANLSSFVSVGALLEYEGIQGLSSAPSMSRTRSTSVGDALDNPTSPEHCFENLVKQVSFVCLRSLLGLR